MLLRMFLRIFFTTLLIFEVSYCADHNTFKNCSRVDFCNSLRSRQPSNDYSIDPSTISSDSNILTATLRSNNGGTDLSLTLYGLQPSTFRLKITEIDSSRYELQDVLDGEPEALDFDNVQIGESSVSVTTYLGSNVATINFSPFSIEFGKDETTVIFNGDQLSLSTNAVNAPFSFGVNFPRAFQLYGIHEHCDRLALSNTSPDSTDPYRLKNSDVAYYEINSPMALYGAVPVIYGHSPNATAGIFLHNAAEQWIETTSTGNGYTGAYFMVETGTLDVFILLGSTIVDVVRQYTALTGTAPLPPIWSLGYHQSRYTYESQEDVLNVSLNFDSYNLPLESIWLDIDYTDGFKYFTWNPNTFSDPVTMQQSIENANKKMVIIINPHVKVETGYNVYDEALANDYLVKYPNGSVYHGQSWPGVSTWIDFLNPSAREYYASMYSYNNFPFTTSTISGIWNDMNEPSVFDTSLENTLPPDAIHYGGVSHREIHNIYGLLHTMSTYDGLVKRDFSERRPFILTRSHFAGSQRYAAFWTGENQADWSYLAASYQGCLNANLLGLVFCGADVGGFMNNPTTELLERWYQAGAWLPFFRSHSAKDTNRREPYLLPEDSQNIIRETLLTRYQHMPTWYTLFYEHFRYGDPVIRPLFYHYPEDVNVYGLDNHLLLGRNILIRPVTEPGVDSVEIYFPGGSNETWVSLLGWGDVQRGNGFTRRPVKRDLYPFYYRFGGTVVKRSSSRLNTVEQTNDLYSILYIFDRSLQANGTIYLDDGISFRHRDFYDYNYNNILINGDGVTITPIDGEGDYQMVVSHFIRVDITKMPENGKSGRYKKTIYTKTADGTFLQDIRINLNQTTVIQLK